jgi:hypothetical protein
MTPTLNATRAPLRVRNSILPIIAVALAIAFSTVTRADEDLTQNAVSTEDLFALAISSDGAEAATADSLYRVNLNTGAGGLIGALGAVGSDFEDVEGLAMDNSGRLFGVDDDTKTLLSINLATGRATSVNNALGNTRIAPSATNAQDLSIAFACNNQLFGVAARSRSFYRVNATTGAFELVGAPGSLGVAITDFTASAGQLYGLGEDALYTIDSNTGLATLVGAYGANIRFVEGGGIGSELNGQLWAIGERRDGSGRVMPSQIYRIDRDTGAATFVSNTSVQGAESLNLGMPSCTRGPGGIVQAPSLNVFGALVLFVLLIGSSLIHTRR